MAMHNYVKLISRLGLGASLVLGAYLALAKTETAKDALPPDVRVGTSEDDGPIYMTLAGMALYSTNADATASGKPGCTNTRYETGTHHLGESYVLSEAMKQRQKTCLEKWPPYVPTADAKPVGKWTIVSRSEGFRQWAYEGRPLYTSIKDRFPGDVNGAAANGGRGGSWRTERVALGFPPGVRLTRTVDGLMLTSSDDDQLLFSPGAIGAKTPAGFSPLSASELAVPNGDWKPIILADGSRQWSFKGQPLYRPGAGINAAKVHAAVADGLLRPIAYQRSSGAPANIKMEYSIAGWVYGDAQGKSLYVFRCNDETAGHLSCDDPGDPALYRSSICGSGEQCSREWRPVLAAAGAKRVGNWDAREVPDPPFSDATGGYGENVPMVRAWTYRGQPVYTFAGDHEPGDINGHFIRYYGVSVFTALKVLGNTRDDGERFFADK